MYDMVTIGTATRDVFIRSGQLKEIRDPKHLKHFGFKTGEAECLPYGAKIEIEPPLMTVGGGAANAAVTFARQGLKTASIFKIGRDETGKDVIRHLKGENVKAMPAYDTKKSTAWSCILIDPKGERTAFVYRGASGDLTAKDTTLPATKWAYIVPGKTEYAEMMRIIKELRAKRVNIAVNPSEYYLKMGLARLQPVLAASRVVIMNREEAALLTGVSHENEKGIFAKFREHTNGIAVMTEGKKGALVFDGKNVYRAGIYAQQQRVDATGAGDAFGSGFVAGLIKKSKIKNQKSKISDSEDAIRYAIRLGSANATGVVEVIGAETGILTKGQFNTGKRWKSLLIKKYPLL